MRRGWALVLCVLGNVAVAEEDPPPVWAVIGSDGMRAAAEPLIEWRKGEGFEVRESSSPDAAVDADYVLLLGDENALPPARLSFYRWMSRQKESYATDLKLVDFDGDGLPDAPLGRIPAEDPEAVASVARKIVRYEQHVAEIGDLGVPVWTGTGMVGQLADEVTLFALLNTLDRRFPAWAEPWVLVGNPRDTFSAHPNDQSAIYNERLAGGGAIAFFMGHGHRIGFHSYDHVFEEEIDGTKRIVGRAQGYGLHHAEALDSGDPACPAIIYACDCGNWATAQTSLAEAMLFAPAGPVASIAATTQSHPLTNYYSGLASVNELAGGREDRIGDFFNAVQREAYFKREPWAEFVLKEVEGKLENEIDIPKLKRDHALMYALLGDPATRLRIPRSLDVHWERDGERWKWKVARPSGTEVGELVLGLRAPAKAPEARAIPEGASAEETLRLFTERNARFEFAERARVAFDQPWVGSVGERGEWRFAVVGGRRVFAAVRLAK